MTIMFDDMTTCPVEDNKQHLKRSIDYSRILAMLARFDASSLSQLSVLQSYALRAVAPMLHGLHDRALKYGPTGLP